MKFGAVERVITASFQVFVCVYCVTEKRAKLRYIWSVCGTPRDVCKACYEVMSS